MRLRPVVTPFRVVATGALVLALHVGGILPARGMRLGPGDDPGGGGTTTFQSEVVDQIGLFRSPSRIALSDTGRLYVADSGGGFVGIYDLAGVRVGTLKGMGRPLGVAVRGARVWVGDESNGSVSIFENGEFAGSVGSGSGEVTKPNGIAVTADRVYVVDSGRDRVAVYDAAGSSVGTFGSGGSGDGELDFPTDIAVNEGASEVYVADFRNQRIAVFDLGGAWLRNISAPPNDSGDPIFYRPSGLGIDSFGHLYVVDTALACVVVMDSAGTLIDVFGYQDASYWTGELRVPIDAASDGLRAYVTSSKDRHVKVFEPDLPCGDGAISPTEDCDDGNRAGGDGCDVTCRVESCFRCDGQPSVCTCDLGAACGEICGVTLRCADVGDQCTCTLP